MVYDDDTLPTFEPIKTTAYFRGTLVKRTLKSLERRSTNHGCIKKMQYSKKQALQARKDALARGVPYIGVYKCPTCRFFHLTSKPPRKNNKHFVI